MDTPARIKELLQALQPLSIEVLDDSLLHAGHSGAAGGGGHYRLEVVSQKFVGLSSVARHRQVYALLAELMPRNIHALSINALTPDEVSSPPISTRTAE